MKRLLTLLTLTALVVTLMAGCGSLSPSPTTAPTPTVAPTEANPGNEPEETSPAELSGSISTNGSTSMEKVIGGLIEAFNARHPAVTITYEATGSSGGITAAADGVTDIGLSSRNLKDSETGLDATIVALDGIAVIVHNANAVSDLSTGQIKGLFNGEITNWKDVGGADAPVSVIGREAGSGTRDGFESIIGVAEACVYDQELTSTGAVITAVASNEYAIGYGKRRAYGGRGLY